MTNETLNTSRAVAYLRYAALLNSGADEATRKEAHAVCVRLGIELMNRQTKAAQLGDPYPAAQFERAQDEGLL